MYSESKYTILVDLIADVVDYMRATGTIDSSTESSPGVYVINTENTLSNKEVVNIDNNDYIVTDVTESTFSITGSTGIDFTGMSWKALAPYYEHGHIKEIANTLNNKSKGDYSYKKYPLIILFQDYKGTKTAGDDALFGSVMANMAIANDTKPELVSNERYDYNFRNTLFPLYDGLLEALKNVRYFQTSPREPYISHEWYERPYWGSNLDSNNKNILDGFIDAIELKNLDLKIIAGVNQTC